MTIAKRHLAIIGTTGVSPTTTLVIDRLRLAQNNGGSSQWDCMVALEMN